jgi:ketosteroid isomerase-like protein
MKRGNKKRDYRVRGNDGQKQKMKESSMATDLEANKAVARRYFELYEAGDPKAALALLTEDATWSVPGKSELAGTQTRAQVEAMLTGELPFVGPLSFTFHDMIAEGNRVAVQIESHGKIKNGTTYNNFYVFIFTIEDGRITHVLEQTDTLYSYRTLIEPFQAAQ